jgi:hypothetical protein
MKVTEIACRGPDKDIWLEKNRHGPSR